MSNTIFSRFLLRRLQDVTYQVNNGWTNIKKSEVNPSPDPRGPQGTMGSQDPKLNWPRNWSRPSFDTVSPTDPISSDETIGPLHDKDQFEFLGSPPSGISFTTFERMPKTFLRPGIYRRKTDGTAFFVKTGLHNAARFVPEPNRSLPNEAARAEHAAHRLYGVLATEQNGITPIDARLHADALHGAEIPDGYGIRPKEGVYSVTQFLPNASNFFDWKKKRKTPAVDAIRRKMAMGFAVDALLSAKDMHGANFMVGPITRRGQPPAIYRVDTGAHLGLDPFGTRMGAGSAVHFDNFGKDPSHSFLPDFSIMDYFTKFTDYLSPQEIIEQIGHVVDTYTSRKDQIIKAVQHMANPQQALDSLNRRIKYFADTYEAYKDHPELLVSLIKEVEKVVRGQQPGSVWAQKQPLNQVSSQARRIKFAAQQAEAKALKDQRGRARMLQFQDKQDELVNRLLAANPDDIMADVYGNKLDTQGRGWVEGWGTGEDFANDGNNFEGFMRRRRQRILGEGADDFGPVDERTRRGRERRAAWMRQRALAAAEDRAPIMRGDANTREWMDASPGVGNMRLPGIPPPRAPRGRGGRVP